MFSNKFQTAGIEKYLTKDGTLTSNGVTKMGNMYRLLQREYGFVVGSIKVTFGENNKRDTIGWRKLLDQNKNHIKQTSYYIPGSNVLMVHTGPEYGDLIGVDIDVKGSKKDGIEVVDHWLKEENRAYTDTFACSTPSGGRHYIYKLTNYQSRFLKNINFSGGQVELFDRDIDIVYKNGRFCMHGFVKKNEGLCEYKIISYTQPSYMPEFLFTELMIKAKKRLRKPTITKILAPLSDDEIKPNTGEVVHKKDVPEGFISKADEKLIVELLKCLKPKRAEDYKSWTRIGMILNNEYASYEIFDNWSKTCPSKYDKKGNRTMWDNLERLNDGLRIGTLIMCAKEDNYNNYYKDHVKKLVNIRLGKEEIIVKKITEQLKNKGEEVNMVWANGFAKFITVNNGMSIPILFKTIYPDKYVYDICNKVWYSKNKYGIYKRDTDELISARTAISDSLLPMFEKYINAYMNSFDPAKQKEKEEMEFLMKTLKNVRVSMTKIGQKKNIIESLKELYGVNRLYKKMNTNIHLFAFENGVYDTQEGIFRVAEANDFVFESCGYKYKKSTEENRKLVFNTIKNMFLKDELFEYFMTIISIRLARINTKEEFYFLIGNASNGKGLVTTLIQETFGERSQVLESASFYKNKHGVSANAASPELASTKDCNIVFVNELERGARLTADNIKKLSGNDKIKVRFLRENCFEFTPGYCLFFVSNHEPEIDGDDFGIRRRLRFIPFNVTFVDNPTKPNERQINRKLKRLFTTDEYKCAFFDILTEYYKKYIDNGEEVIIPEDVECKSKEYIQNNDPVFNFVDQQLERTTNQRDIIPAKMMMDLFVKSNDGNKRGYTMGILKNRLSEFGINQKKTNSCMAFYCVKQKVNEEADEIDEVID